MLLAVDIGADAPTIYRAITTQPGEASFWTSDCDIEPVVGSVARFGFPSAPVDLRMRIDELTEPRLVRWTCLGDFPHWAETVVSWSLQPAASRTGTSVTFRQEGWPDGYPDLEYAQVTYTWGRILGALKAYAEGGLPQRFLG